MPKQEFERFANRNVVIDNEYDGWSLRHGERPHFKTMCIRMSIVFRRHNSRNNNYLTSNAESNASSSAASLNGLIKHAIAPCSMRRDRSASFLWAVMKIIGILI